MRVRLTIAVGVVAACFLALATYLLNHRASTQVLDGVKADQVLLSGISSAASPPLPAAVDVYRQLTDQGLLRSFYQALGQPEPVAPASVVLTDGPENVTVTGTGSGDVLVLPASLVMELGMPLLRGLPASDLLVVGSTIESQAAPQGGFVVSTTGAGTAAFGAVPIGNVQRSVNDIGRSLWIAAGLLTLLAMGATWLLTGWALRPVEAITKRVEEINAAGSGDRVPVPPAHDEIGHLARTVNTMLDRLDGAAVAQRRFVADASHELRSPLAAIRTETEVALARPIDADWTEVGQHVLDETDRLEGLVTDLLVLARRDDGQAVEVVSGTTDVEEVVLAEAARRRRVPIDTARVLAGRVRARPGDVQRIVRHLLDNAARHARSTVWASVTADGTDVLLAVDDDGEGVPGAERERIFERFARLDDARSRDHGGAGLGLAVVAALVRDLGGAVVVTDAPGGGARFEVRLPGAGDHVA